MMPIKAIGVATLLAISAFSLAQDKVKIETKWAKDQSYKMKLKSSFEVGGMAVTLDAKLAFSGKMDDDGCTVNVHHDEIAIMVADNEVSPPVSDYKIGYDKNATMNLFEGGIDGADPLRMFLVVNFFAPKVELTKDTVAKWDVAKNEKTSLGALKIETTFLGDEMVGKKTVHKFKQVVSETGTEYTTTGTFLVTTDGHVVKADVTFKGMPVPVASGEANGKMALSLIE